MDTATEEVQEAVEAARAIQPFYNDMAEKAGTAAMPQPAVHSVFLLNDTTPQFSLYSRKVGKFKLLEKQFPPHLCTKKLP